MYLFGASGHAKVIADILEQMGEKVEGIIDDNKQLKEFMGMPVTHHIEEVSPMIICIGMNDARKKTAKRLLNIYDVQFGKAIHPAAIISEHTEINDGSVVMPRAVVQTGTKIGKHCIINSGAVLEHECNIGDFCHISPHATLCGNVTVGEGSWVGAGATIIQGVKIGRWSIIGAGSVVTKDIPDGVVAYGTPCHKVRRINENLLDDSLL